jgi:hypothetical protein
MGDAVPSGNIEFVQNSSALHLNLWKKGLGNVPDSVWERTEIETLVLAENNLLEVSEQIGRLKRLGMLDLGHACTSGSDSDQDCRSVGGGSEVALKVARASQAAPIPC